MWLKFLQMPILLYVESSMLTNFFSKKEIRFGPNTDDHDFDFKLNHAKNFLQEGSKVRAYVFFKGRSVVFKDRGELLLLKFIKELDELAACESLPKLEGKKMFILLSPRKGVVKTKS